MKLKVDHFSKWLLLLTFTLMGHVVLAQRTITGTVTDEATGEPLIGANVLVVGTSTGTVTDFNGEYSLEVSEEATTLEFSYTGYSKKQVEIGASNIINATLAPGEVLDEVVVVGYGTQQAKEVTGSVTSVKEEDFNRGNVNDPAQLLQGKVSGLTISSPGGDPNQGFNIRLRGLSTLGANTQPLVVIDGVIGADLENVDPNDIKSIDVLKDASASAIYGSRGSSGVILVTTKSGEAGTTQVDYNGYVATDAPYREIEVLGADEYLEFGGNPVGNGQVATDWTDEVTRNSYSQVHNLSLSGGNQSSNYRVALNYRGIEGILNNTGFDRINGRLNFNQKALDDRLNLQVNITATNRKSDFEFSEALRYAIIYNPTAPVRVTQDNNPANLNPEDFESFGGFHQFGGFDNFNPVAIDRQTINQGEAKRILGSFRADLEILPGLKAGAFYSRERNSFQNFQYFGKRSLWIGRDDNGRAVQRTDETQTDLVEGTVEYTRDLIPDLNMDIITGYSWQELQFFGFNAQNENFLTDAFTFNNLGVGTGINDGMAAVGSYNNGYKVIAGFGRVSFNYDDTYFLSGSARREGSSRFGEENKWGWFGSVSAGLNITNLVDIGPFDNLKVRGGYGITGNLPGDNFRSLRLFGPTGNQFFFNGEFVPSFGPFQNPNPDLRWERLIETNVGIDFALLDFRVSGTIEYYNRATEDLLNTVEVPVPPNLVGTTLLNVGEIENQGIEVALNVAAIQQPNFTWETGVTFATFESELVTLFDNDVVDIDDRANAGSPGLQGTNFIRLEEGEEIGNFFGPVFTGLDENGRGVFEDLDGDGTFCDCPDDFAILGNGLPDGEFGWNNTFTYGNWSLNFFLRGAFGHDIINTFRLFYEPQTTTWNRVAGDKFNPDLTESKFSSLFVEDGDFVSLDNITLAYEFSLPETSLFRRLRLYATGQNVFVITDYTGSDPNVRFTDPGTTDNGNSTGQSQTQGDPLSPGIDRRNQFFLNRTITFGINLGF